MVHPANKYRQSRKDGIGLAKFIVSRAPFYAFAWFGASIWGMRYCNSASGIFRVSLALKGLHIIAQGTRRATLGRVDKTKPILNSASGVLRVSLALKGLHIIAQGKPGATLGWVDKTKPILTLKGSHKMRIPGGYPQSRAELSFVSGKVPGKQQRKPGPFLHSGTCAIASMNLINRIWFLRNP